MIRRGHCLTCKPRVKKIRFVNKLFDIFAVAALIERRTE
ncbi:Mobile element protein (plasmid) [Acidisarcina polymorpha]|uniref:Mobile element protein n=1 Tax=Acidisarcina polymorpha TaxID=2211140 RepID=A0A2Z5GAV3_9BACT|nr:Mobile element protein [Acidisarcina polymorpha]